MTEDSNQLSVAELLARNGQQGSSSGGGGRRRRSGRGLSVADLTGDMPVLPGSSSHAAPDEAESASEPASNESDFSNYSNYSDYSNFSYETPQQDYSYSPPASENSPLSGPISYYDPLSQLETPSARSLSEGSGYEWNSPGQADWSPAESAPNGRNGANGHGAHGNGYDAPPNGHEGNGFEAGGYGAVNGHGAQADYGTRNGYGAGYDAEFGAEGNGYGATGYASQANGLAPTVDRPQGGRRRKPDPLSDPLSPQGGYDVAPATSPPPAVPGSGGRRRRFDPDEDTEDVEPYRAPEPGRDAGLELPPWGAPKAEPLPNNSPEWGAAPPPMSRSARRHAERQAEPAFEADAWQGAEAPLDDEGRRVAELLRGDGPPPRAPEFPQRGGDFPRGGDGQRMAEFPHGGGIQRGPDFPGEGGAQRGPDFSREGGAQRGPDFAGDGARSAPDFAGDGGARRAPDFPRDGGPQRGAEFLREEPWRGGEPPRDGDPRRGAELPHEDSRRGARSGAAAGGLPAWSARRRQPTEPAQGHAPSEERDAWSLASQDQQLVSGETVAGDLLRDAHDREDEPRSRRSRRSGERSFGKGAFGRKSRSSESDDMYEGATDIYSPLLDDDEIEDDERTSVAERFGALATRARRTRTAPLSDDDENRRQWMILGGQSTGAAVAGMLLFKGFERMWEMLPWVALALAMIVILGLVALVRVLRRTDDIFSTVIAVVVGVFVTLGPLAFLLSTT